MEPSEEIRRVVARFFEALRDADEEGISNRISGQPGFERIGSDPDEVWHEGEDATRVWLQQVREMGGYRSICSSRNVQIFRDPQRPCWAPSRDSVRH